MPTETPLSPHSAQALDGLEPKSFWRLFGTLSQIARPSKDEGVVRDHMVDWAHSHNLSTQVDDAGNVFVDVPATPGHEHAPKVVLQAHLDMVCERDPSSPNDPAEGRIELLRDGDWLTADGTTLGADDGIGVVAMQNIIEDGTLVHGPLQLVFTVAEEVGLVGANGLDGSLIDGEILINLDSEEDGTLTVGCAGSTDTWIHIETPRSAVSDDVRWFEVAVAGGLGGHSGMEITLGRSNANKVLAQVLGAAADSGIALRLSSFNGGKSRNAIPRDARAYVAVPVAESDSFDKVVSATGKRVAAAHADTDRAVGVSVTPADSQADAWSATDSRRMLDAINALPTGPIAMSTSLPGLTETSSSLGEVVTDGNKLTLHSLSRSSNDPAMPAVISSIESVARLAGGTLEERFNYAGWLPNMDSKVLAAAERVYEREFGEKPEVTGVHAGLETAVIGAKVPGIDMLAIGPQIESPHSPDERVDTATVTRFWKLVAALLKELS